MRRSVLLLMACAIAAGLTGCHAGRHPPRRPPAAVEVKAGKPISQGQKEQAAAVAKVKVEERPAPHRGIQWEVDGWGSNQGEAEADALKRAAEKLDGFLQTLKPPLHVTLAPDYVRQQFVHGNAQRRPDQDQAVNDVVQLQCWSLPVSVTPEDYAILARNARQARIEEERTDRMRIAAWVLGEVLILILGLRGLLLLVEWRGSIRQASCGRQGLRAAKLKAVAVACLLLAVVMGLFFLA